MDEETGLRSHENFKTNPPLASTNHDLQRALAHAYSSAGFRWVNDFERNVRISDFRETEKKDLTDFCQRVRGHLAKLSDDAAKRYEDFKSDVDESLMLQLVDSVPEITSSIEDYASLTKMLTKAFKIKLVDWEGQDLPGVADLKLNLSSKVIDGQSHDLFGQEVLATFIDNLKSGKYPEATIAFEQRILGQIRQEVGYLRDDLGNLKDGQISANILILQRFDEVDTNLDEIALQVARIENKQDQIENLSQQINHRMGKWWQITLTKPSIADTQNTFLQMSFEHEGTQFLGRDAEMAQLRIFLVNEDPSKDTSFLWWQVAGDGGQGKSRLALQLLNEMPYGWRAGFIKARDFSSVDWAKVEVYHPTLIIVDYLTAPSKVAKFIEAVDTLHARYSNRLPGITPPVHKIRFLVLERAGYDMENRNSASTASWFGQVTKGTEYAAFEARAFQTSAMELEPLSNADMIGIANSWRAKKELQPLLPDEETQFLDLMRKPDAEGNLVQTSAWRPLFAMLFAEHITEFEKGGSLRSTSIYEILEHAFEHEREKHWEGKQLRPEAFNLACLAIMCGEIRFGDHCDSLRNIEPDGEPADIFYAAFEDEICEQAWMASGYRRFVKQDEELLPLTARQPDLLGEFLVLWVLGANIARQRVKSEERTQRLAVDAWNIAPNDFIAFMVRLREDFPDRKVTNIIAVAPLTGNETGSLSDQGGLNLPAYFGLAGLTQVLIDADSDINNVLASGAFPLLLAAQNGYHDVVKMLIDTGAETNRVDETSGNFPLLMAAQNGHHDVVKMLIDAGADPHRIHTISGMSTIDLSFRIGNLETLEILADAVNESKKKPNEHTNSALANIQPQANWPIPSMLPWAFNSPEHAIAEQALDYVSIAQRLKRLIAGDVIDLRATTPDFYRDSTLVEMLFQAQGSSERSVITIILHPDGGMLLDGTLPPIHALNTQKSTPLDLSTMEKGQAYLQFFCAFVHGEEGPFRIIESLSEARLIDASNDTEVPEFDTLIKPIKFDDLEGDAYMFTASLAYSTLLSRANFQVFPTGMIEMSDDEPLAIDIPFPRYRFDGSLLRLEL